MGATDWGKSGRGFRILCWGHWESESQMGRDGLGVIIWQFGVWGDR